MASIPLILFCDNEQSKNVFQKPWHYDENTVVATNRACFICCDKSKIGDQGELEIVSDEGKPEVSEYVELLKSLKNSDLYHDEEYAVYLPHVERPKDVDIHWLLDRELAVCDTCDEQGIDCSISRPQLGCSGIKLQSKNGCMGYVAERFVWALNELGISTPVRFFLTNKHYTAKTIPPHLEGHHFQENLMFCFDGGAGWVMTLRRP